MTQQAQLTICSLESQVSEYLDDVLDGMPLDVRETVELRASLLADHIEDATSDLGYERWAAPMLAAFVMVTLCRREQ